MWKCAQCGETIADEVDVCRKCGMPRDEAEKASQAPPDRPLTEASFATVMLRILGLYFAAFGALSLVTDIGHIVVRANKLGLDKALERFTVDYFIYPLGELVVGLYFLVGGQWVFNKILTPVRRPPHDDDFDKPV